MKSYYYLLINLGVIFVPLLLSFDKNVQFWKKRKAVLQSIFVVGTLFVIGDVFYTAQGFWGFNETYLTGISIYNLPIEEVLFFITIPYACLFIYENINYYLPKEKLIKHLDKLLWIFYLFFGLSLVLFFKGQYYSLVTGVFSMLIAAFFLYKRPEYSPYLAVMLLLSQIPFLLVNGILTGTGIENEIVWYSSEAISNIRIISIPIEDFSYSFNMLAMNVIALEYFKAK